MITDRHRKGYALRKEGRTFTSIGETLGVSRQRASQIVEHAIDEIDVRPNDPLCMLVDSIVDDRRLANQIINTLHAYHVNDISDLASLDDYRIRTMHRFGPYSEEVVLQMRDIARGGY